MNFGALHAPLGAAYEPVAACVAHSVADDPLETVDDVMGALEAGQMQAWVASDGDTLHSVTVTEILEGGAGKQCFIRHCAKADGGSGISEWLGFLPVIEGWAVSQGCKTVELIGRAGWERMLPGFEKKAVLLRKELTL